MINFKKTINNQLQIQWVDMDYTASDSYDTLEKLVPDLSVIESLLREDTRPRFQRLDHGFLLFLRAINLNQDSSPEDMVSLRIFSNDKILVTAHKRKILSLEKLRTESLTEYENQHNLVIKFIDEINEKIALHLDQESEILFEYENPLSEVVSSKVSVYLGDMRRRSAQLKRFLLPQKEAIEHYYRFIKDGIKKDNDLLFQDNIDHIAYLIEELTILIERVHIAENNLSNKLIEQQNARIYQLSIIAGVFLPLTFITGLFGMNTTSIPFDHDEQGFIKVALIIFLVGAGSWIYLKFKKWI